VLFDSEEERRFADMLDKSGEVSVYVKLPKGFYITTPVGGTAPTGHRLS
jgi:type III restriction enzyme